MTPRFRHINRLGAVGRARRRRASGSQRGAWGRVEGAAHHQPGGGAPRRRLPDRSEGGRDQTPVNPAEPAAAPAVNPAHPRAPLEAFCGLWGSGIWVRLGSGRSRGWRPPRPAFLLPANQGRPEIWGQIFGRFAALRQSRPCPQHRHRPWRQCATPPAPARLGSSAPRLVRAAPGSVASGIAGPHERPLTGRPCGIGLAFCRVWRSRHARMMRRRVLRAAFYRRIRPAGVDDGHFVRLGRRRFPGSYPVAAALATGLASCLALV